MFTTPFTMEPWLGALPYLKLLLRSLDKFYLDNSLKGEQAVSLQSLTHLPLDLAA